MTTSTIGCLQENKNLSVLINKYVAKPDMISIICSRSTHSLGGISFMMQVLRCIKFSKACLFQEVMELLHISLSSISLTFFFFNFNFLAVGKINLSVAASGFFKISSLLT